MSDNEIKYKEKFRRNHLDWFIPFVSEFYPLTKFQMLRYEDILDWSRVKANNYIRWDPFSTLPIPVEILEGIVEYEEWEEFSAF